MMKRHLKLIVLILVLLALVCTYLIYNSTLKADENNEESTENAVINVLSMYSGEISSIKYTFEEKEVSLVKKDNSWKWAEDADFPVNSVYPESMASALSNITALRVISDDASNYGEYGLDVPSLEVSFDTVDGKSYVYSVGDHNAVTGGYYFKINTGSKVYLSASDLKLPFDYSVYDMMQTDDFPTIKSENVKKLEYVLNNKKHTITTDNENADFFADIYSYFLVDENGKVRVADGKSIAELFVSLVDLKLEKCEMYKPDNNALEKMGFGDDKRIDFTVTYDDIYSDDSASSNIIVSNEKTYEFSLGVYENEHSKVYCIREKDSLAVYNVSSSIGEKLLNALNMELESKYVCPVPSEKVDTFTLEGAGKTYSKTADDLKNDSTASAIYNKVISLVSEGKAEKAKGELCLTAEFKIGENTLELRVYKYDDSHYIASFDKFDNMLVSAESINAIIELLK